MTSYAKLVKQVRTRTRMPKGLTAAIPLMINEAETLWIAGFDRGASDGDRSVAAEISRDEHGELRVSVIGRAH